MFFGMWHALADVIAKLMADVIAMLCGRCYNHQADGIACIIEQGGRCYCHVFVCGRCYANPVYMLQLICGRC